MNFERRRKKRQRPAAPRSPGQKPPPQGESFVVRKGDGFVADFVEGSLKLESLTHGAGSKGLEAMVATAEPGAACWETRTKSGDKWYYILEGKLEVVVNDVSYTLKQGDSIYLDSDAQHIWRNPGKRRARALVLTSPPPARSKRKPNESGPRE